MRYICYNPVRLSVHLSVPSLAAVAVRGGFAAALAINNEADKMTKDKELKTTYHQCLSAKTYSMLMAARNSNQT